MTFLTKLTTAQQANRSWLCVGLDPVLDRLPEAVLATEDPLLAFGRAIVEATADLVCAYKPNLAFWLAGGSAGLRALQDLVAGIPNHLPVILDGKFNDVGHTATAYARAAFDVLGVDAVRPFLASEEHGVFLLTRTSNPSAPDLQDQLAGGHPLYQQVARLAVEWNATHPGTCGLVVGATYPEELAHLREIAPDLPFLIPGIGAQGGSLAAASAHGPTASGAGPLINSSRDVIYASSKPDFAEAARTAARTLRDQINGLREGVNEGEVYEE